MPPRGSQKAASDAFEAAKPKATSVRSDVRQPAAGADAASAIEKVHAMAPLGCGAKTSVAVAV